MTTTETHSIPISAWKRLGTQLSSGVRTWKAAIAEAKLDWTVKKIQLANPTNGDLLPIWGNFKGAEFIGKSGKDYEIVQNANTFEWADPLVQSDPAARYIAAGAIGPMIFCLVSLPEQVRIKGTDDVTNHSLVFVNYHEAGRAGIIKLLGDREICSNGLTVPVANQLLSLVHRPSVHAVMERSKLVVGALRTQIHHLDSAMNTLARTKLDVSTVGAVVRSVYPNIEESAQAQNRARHVLELFEDNDGGAFPAEADTAYALMNAFTNQIDHHAGARGEDEEKTRAKNALFGAGESLKFVVLTSLVAALGRNSLASFSDKEVTALGIR